LPPELKNKIMMTVLVRKKHNLHSQLTLMTEQHEVGIKSTLKTILAVQRDALCNQSRVLG
jgi:hypothetical protein